ncbi:MAG TPA: UDP-N-acetylmuramoyl-L-alanyl-D-glutamate--2,6-diaminopimelate ligase [archaeon]|nr:UDP-N-acetylmuramoyl-L-alanyl-D-glutamate--2,6-diaminopimelate ligase [archaeon]
MNLTYLLRSVDVLEIVGSIDRDISSVFFDSRQSKVGGLFVALKGISADGHSYIPSVLASGATAVMCESLPETISNATCYIKVLDTNEALGILAANFYDNPTQKLKLVGVTGTNGKTTTATSLFHIFRKMGYKVGLFSTIENRIEDDVIPSTHTTPDALQLQSLMSKMVDSGCTHCFMEVSSHAIHQRRIAGLNFAGGLFTNLTHDHLDYHKTLEGYYLAKKKFFDDLPSTAFCLTNLDDGTGLSIIQDTKARKFTYSLKQNADFVGKIIRSDLTGTSIEVAGNHIASGLRGRFNAYNMLVTYACATLLGEQASNIANAFGYLQPVRGRFDVIRAPNGMFGIVDFAHSPDSLLNILLSIRQTIPVSSRIITVSGCGGDRDRGKRPMMGSIVYANSDICIFTSDNPRSEDPEAILSEIRSGLPPDDQTKAAFIVDRREAIRFGCSLMNPMDVILVAGKGHEDYQEIGGKKFPFDDCIVLNEILSSL